MDPLPFTTSRGKRRWRPRFSLLTLVMFVLTVGSGGTLWWNWGPWRLKRAIIEKGEIGLVAFDAKNRCFVSYSDTTGPSGSVPAFSYVKAFGPDGAHLKTFE